MFGTGGDAKGQPTQTNSITHGSPWLRIRKILVGASATAGPPQMLGVIEPGLILVRGQGEGGTVNLLAWRIAVGRFYRVATLDTTASVAVADLTPAR